MRKTFTLAFVVSSALGIAATAGTNSSESLVGRGSLTAAESSSTVRFQAVKVTKDGTSRLRGSFSMKPRDTENERNSFEIRSLQEFVIEGNTAHMSGEGVWVRRWREEVQQGRKRKKVWRQERLVGPAIVTAMDNASPSNPGTGADAVALTFSPPGRDPIQISGTLSAGDLRIAVRSAGL